MAVLTLNRPHARNALNAALVEALLAHLRAYGADAEVRAVVLAANGPAFCAGADLRELPAGGFDEAVARVDLAVALHAAAPRMRTPVIAAVGGPAVAGGSGLALSCDLVIASEAAWFGYPEVRRGLVAALVMVNLQRLVGRRIALELLLTGRRVDAHEARALGMVTEVVPAGEELARACERASEIAASPPAAVALTKELFQRVGELPYDAARGLARDANLLMRRTDDARAGTEAFLGARR